MIKQLVKGDLRDMIGSFKSMVKSGETYYTEIL